MKKYSLELFMPMPSDAEGMRALENMLGSETVRKAWLLSAGGNDAEIPSKCELLAVDSLLSTSLFNTVAERASADYVLFFAKNGIEADLNSLDAFVQSVPEGASMAYSHYRKSIGGVVANTPTIDYFPGCLRNDFDFGSMLLFSVPALKKYLEQNLKEYKYAGLYQLRLAMDRLGGIFHYCEYVYTEAELDTRKSGEKQFDYVNPAQREVQVEMEKVCTHHLKEIGAWLPPCKYEALDVSEGEFPVEASVVIPVLNRRSTIADAIGSVLAQKTSFPFNIIVVDNHSTDGTGEIVDSFADGRVVHVVPQTHDLGIGGCWNLAVNSGRCGRFAVQLDSDDLYSDENVLQRIVDEFYSQQCAMLVGTYRICDFDLNTLPPGVIDHREWTEDNGRNNALRINGLGAPRAFYTPVIREIGFPNVSYGEDYAVGLKISRRYRLGRIYDVLYLCRRWGGNSDAALSHEKVNAHNLYKDSLRTAELEARKELLGRIGIPSREELGAFIEEQLSQWPDAAERHAALVNVETRDLGNGVLLQHNPARAVSTAAKVDKASVAARKCFLCAGNRPSEQIARSALGTVEVLVNPYPILPLHLTLPLKEHSPQLIKGFYADMLNIAREWPDMALFYNGAMCGASAPDHAHLQAGSRAAIPLFGDCWREEISCGMEPVTVNEGGAVYYVSSFTVPMFMIAAGSVSASAELFTRLLKALPVAEGEEEPGMNLFACYETDEGYVTMVLPRSAHRPAAYYASGVEQRIVSPGAIDMAGLVITPRREDFVSIGADEALGMLREVAISQDEADAVVNRLAQLPE